MTDPVSQSTGTAQSIGHGLSSGTASAPAFDASLQLEQADLLLRRTDQYGPWQLLRQNNDTEARRLAPVLLERADLLARQRSGESNHWQRIEQLSSQLRQAGLNLPPSPPPTPAGAQTTPAPATAAKADTLLDEDNLLILTATSPALGLKRELLAYGDSNRVLLPLGEVARALELAITVNPQQKTAEGWLIAEDRTFRLDARQRTIRVDGVEYPWDEEAIAAGRDDIYVDSRVLGTWLPVDFTIVQGEMAVGVRPREQLPIQARRQREQSRLGLKGGEDMSLKYTPSQSPYKDYSFPVMDIALSTGLDSDRHGESILQASHSLLAEGDLARMGAKVFVSGNERRPLDSARFTLDRVDQGHALLGPLHASRVAVGDVSPVRLPILGSRQAERGLAVSSGDLRRSRDFDTTRFEGSTQPGWDVELYQNGNLIDSVRVGGDGRYRFEEVPVFFGANAFQLLAHGPQGQRRIISTKNINVGAGMLKAGTFEYNLSATQQKNTLLGLDEAEDLEDNQGSPRLTGQIAYGLTDHLSATAGWSRVEFNDTMHTYWQAGMSGTISSLYGALDTMVDSAGGTGQSLQAQTSLGPVNLRGKYELFSDFIDEDNPDRILKERISLTARGRLPDWAFLPPLTWTLGRENTVYEDLETGRTGVRLAGQLHRLHLSNLLNFNDLDTGRSTAPINGEFQASGSVGRTRITAGLGYDLGDEGQGINQYKLSARRPLDQGLSLGASLVRDVGDAEQTSSRVYLDVDNGAYILTPSLSYDSEHGFGAFVGLTFSLGKNPVNEEMVMQSRKRSGSGSATALVYHDANNNKVFDQGDEPLPDVRLRARQARMTARTNDQGIAQFTGLVAHEPVDVEVDHETLQDPFWKPSIPGVAVLPRAGSVQSLELPVVTTGEIDGRIAFAQPDGTREPLAGVRLELRDQQGRTVQTALSEYDGFYLFEQVFPGTYILQVHSDDPRVEQSAGQWSKEVTITNNGTIARGNDILLRAIEGMPGGSGGSGGSSRPTPTPAVAKKQEAAGQPVLAAPPPAAATPHSSPKPAASIRLAPLTVLTSQPAPPVSGQEPSSPPISAADDQAKPSSSLRIAPLAVEEGEAVLQRASRPGRPAPSARETDGQRLHAVHLASYATLESARTGMQFLRRRLSGVMDGENLTLTRVDLGPGKGVFYRVTCGEGATMDTLERLADRLRAKIGVAQILPVNYGALESGPVSHQAAPRLPSTPDPKAIARAYAAMQAMQIPGR